MDRRKRCENRFNRAAEKARVLLAIAAMAPRDVFGELHGYTLSKKADKPDKAFYWARFMFKDIYSIFPRAQDIGPPRRPSGAVLQWILTMRPKPPKKPTTS
jgi:hypothetical protein